MPVEDEKSMLLPLLESMRPRQWTKNLLLFAGVIFTRNLSNLVLLGRSIAGFALFCALSGAVYLVNDLKDVEADRLHPRKKNRPIASGRLSPGLAWSASVVISLIALVLSFLMGFHFGLCALVYLILVTLYSLHLKHYVIVDLMLVALGFVIRALAGIMVITVDEMHPEITSWFIACTLFLALFLALCKRRHELTLLTEGVSGHRRVLEEYSMDFLDQMVSVTTSATVISYALWCNFGTFREYRMIYTLPFVLYGIFRYLYNVYRRKEGGAPEIVLLRDRALQVGIFLWLIAILYLLYMYKPAS